jgi:hypothetical protein
MRRDQVWLMHRNELSRLGKGASVLVDCLVGTNFDLTEADLKNLRALKWVEEAGRVSKSNLRRLKLVVRLRDMPVRYQEPENFPDGVLEVLRGS